MKKQAKKNYKRNKKNSGGGYASGYSDSHAKVTLHKKGHSNFKSTLYCYCNSYGISPYLSNAPWK